ncbi:Nif3-like dinuclear metal center hexameric protein [Thiorhodovibrio frisius]|uniref:Dinuclear metal center protein, YbgI/SA1388 family n=1 Tax=Thiorhodovibrio frisius TaxID=631362 RepID=H8Z5U2_9GAMM|nr:Nif3-like dinuclear metal center hexameric protein [Thiorhodovibrio frisius]EIC19576.1 dinuclear metal center protein, YbgI/SA1388 family [Thiorhodovibrio frisius]WPL20462.1 metal-binding protein [Thiorhodovibrio frisius]
MIELKTLVDYCADCLSIADFQDYCPNGLQVEGASRVARIVTGVTASQALIDAAAADGADALLVHHGFFWKGEDPCLVGIKGRRIKALHAAEMSLLAYHLPLDAHAELGNNRCLAGLLGIEQPAPASASEPLLWCGYLPSAQPAQRLCERIAEALGRSPLHIAASERPIHRLAWCTGGGQRYIEQAATLGVDAFLSGEISESTTHQAREFGVDYFAIGHHASERGGICALGEHLGKRFGLEHRFIDINNPA